MAPSFAASDVSSVESEAKKKTPLYKFNLTEEEGSGKNSKCVRRLECGTRAAERSSCSVTAPSSDYAGGENNRSIGGSRCR